MDQTDIKTHNLLREMILKNRETGEYVRIELNKMDSFVASYEKIRLYAIHVKDDSKRSEIYRNMSITTNMYLLYSSVLRQINDVINALRDGLGKDENMYYKNIFSSDDYMSKSINERVGALMKCIGFTVRFYNDTFLRETFMEISL